MSWKYEYACVADWGWKIIFIKNAMQEVAEKLKKWEYAAVKEITKNNENWNNSLRSMIRNHEQWVCSFTIWTYWAVETYLRSSSSSYYIELKKSVAAKLECCETQERIWVFLETFLVVNMLDEILKNFFFYSRNLATPSGIADEVDDSEKRSWEQWERRTIAINTFTLLFSKSEEKTSRRQISLMSMTNHVLGLWTSSGMTLPSYLHL